MGCYESYAMCAITTNSIEIPSYRRSLLWPQEVYIPKRLIRYRIAERAPPFRRPAMFFQDNILN